MYVQFSWKQKSVKKVVMRVSIECNFLGKKWLVFNEFCVILITWILVLYSVEQMHKTISD